MALKVEVMQAWWTLARVRGLKRLTREQAALADELLASVRVRFETGTVGQYAVLRLEVLRDRLRDDLGDFVQAEAELVAALDAAVGAEGGSYVTPDTIAARPPPEEADWLAIADAHRPALAQLVAERRAAARAATLARVEARPSPTLWAGYRVRVIDTPEDAGTDFASVGIGVPVPSGSARRGRAERTAALDEVAAAEADAEALRDTIERDVTAVLSAWRRAHDKATTYDTRLVPAARAALDAVRADFAVGRAPFASLFEAEVALVELERARLVAAVDTWMARATALAVLGTLPDGPGVQP